jgi:hypothetical protein
MPEPDVFQIHCINQDTTKDEDRRIDNVGGVHNGTRWKISVVDAINGIEAGKWKFFTHVDGKSAWVYVAKHPTSGRKYLTTVADGHPKNNLLSLPECP